MQFEQRKEVENTDKKVLPSKLQSNSDRKESESNEVKPANLEMGTQTDNVETATLETDVANLEENYDKIEDKLEVDKNGIIKCKEMSL